MLASLPAFGQVKLYAVQGKDFSLLVNHDHSAFALEKAFEYKSTFGFLPDEVAVLPDSKTKLVVLWMRIQNVSSRPFELNVSSFTATDDQKRTYSALNPDEAAGQIIAGTAVATLGTKTLNKLSLGRAQNKATEEQMRDDIIRYSLRSGVVEPQEMREGLIYFEAPTRKKFSLSVILGSLWTKPLLFSTQKQ
jgi:hypothetical protein